jgi:hypothetical protein
MTAMKRWRGPVSTCAELVGMAWVVAAVWLLSPIAGLAAAGACLMLIGYALDSGRR